ncbi:MAG: WYL domain-containing protein, partial [Oscillospiraceae bacterium]|nr:WYL domain-containing protein [Oscillospiraceae bacterium]
MKGDVPMNKDRTLPFEKDDSRLRILYLYQILRKYTDESHTLSTYEIMERLKTEHGISMHRTTLPKDMEVLRAAGIEVMTERRRTLYYYLPDSPLSVPELRLLADAVLSSKFITEKKSEELVEKLISLTSETNAGKLRRTVHVTGKAKSDNEKGYYIVDAINEAIHLGRKISFTYFDYNGKKERVLRNNGAPYTVSPYDLIWDGDYYYLTGFCDERNDIRTFRVDRIEKQPEITGHSIVPRKRGYRVEKYTQEVFRMYATQKTAEVRLLCDNDMMKAVIDCFGSKVRTRQMGKDRFR